MTENAVAKQTRLSSQELAANITLPKLCDTTPLDTPQIHELIGQERAKRAVEFGLGIASPGYNMYVMGEQATGRFTLIRDYIALNTQRKTQLYDYLYLNNLDNEREPRVLMLPAGESKAFVADMETLIDEVLATFPASYENPGYQRRKAAITRHFEQKYDKAIDEVEKLAFEKGVALVEEGNSVSFAPIVEGQPVSDADFSSQPDQMRKHYYDIIDELELTLTEALLELPSWQREAAEQQKQLKQQLAEQGVRPLIKELEQKYSSNIHILKYLKQLKTNMVDVIVETLSQEHKEDKQDEFDKRGMLIEMYLPNTMVSNKQGAAAPLIYEANPSYQNLFGKIEYTSVQGSVYTNYRMITAGALHRANGGYLVLDADKLLSQAHVWEALKLALKFERIKLELPQQEVGMVNSITQNPEPIGLDVKVILLGSRDLYYTLQDYDPEFPELFRVLVDFESDIELNEPNLTHFVKRLEKEVEKLGLQSIDRVAIEKLVAHSLRIAEHQSKLSARFADILELIHEAKYFCEKSQRQNLLVEDVVAALGAKKMRTGRVSDNFLQDIQEGHVLISTEGLAVGTLNGLTVLEIGDTAFGTPARVTATVYAGSSGVVDIEREVELGQSIHSKGVLLLTGYLGNKYAQEFSLTLSANIALEQSYGYIDGDSASLGELLALISALTDIPLKQSIAVTGSINQLGEVQAVGGINEKIEGYFELCSHRGLNGEQGVIIPRSNRVNLMLNEDVRNAVEAGSFHVYAVDNVDQAISIMTGKDAGVLNTRGRFPKHSVHERAVNRLYAISVTVNGGHDE
ncbi:Lon protease family protein [Glaciecola sp. XM2]|uniref:Lon protease family protein n=1 Tax=Glaciecola sp. XM2 TaxID=1914931 RepID=UPI001BDE89A3|nr:AAA family ATPase [Glaciecola sp. XM2]MBT1452031.1 Lon protease family protein [Glaciecola sp. XM2]